MLQEYPLLQKHALKTNGSSWQQSHMVGSLQTFKWVITVVALLLEVSFNYWLKLLLCKRHKNQPTIKQTYNKNESFTCSKTTIQTQG